MGDFSRGDVTPTPGSPSFGTPPRRSFLEANDMTTLCVRTRGDGPHNKSRYHPSPHVVTKKKLFSCDENLEDLRS